VAHAAAEAAVQRAALEQSVSELDLLREGMREERGKMEQEQQALETSVDMLRHQQLSMLQQRDEVHADRTVLETSVDLLRRTHAQEAAALHALHADTALLAQHKDALLLTLAQTRAEVELVEASVEASVERRKEVQGHVDSATAQLDSLNTSICHASTQLQAGAKDMQAQASLLDARSREVRCLEQLKEEEGARLDETRALYLLQRQKWSEEGKKEDVERQLRREEEEEEEAQQRQAQIAEAHVKLQQVSL